MTVIARHAINVTINGRPTEFGVSPNLSLLELLRTEAGSPEVKLGCGEGVCGTCTVLLDGEPVSSCLVFSVQVDGCEITTVRGLAPEGELHDLQRAFLDHAGSQCGFCTPGMLLTAKWYLDRHPTADREELRSAIAGTCAAAPATQRSSTPSTRTATSSVGRTAMAIEAGSTQAREASVKAPAPPTRLPSGRTSLFPHRDFVEKVAGTPPYADDWGFPGILHGVVVRARIACALITRIDTSAAKEVPGVRAVLTAADIPYNAISEEASGLGIDRIVQPVLAHEQIRYDGEPVACIAAETPGAAVDAAGLVEVEYEDAEGVFTIDDALAERARTCIPAATATSRIAPRSAMSTRPWPRPTTLWRRHTRPRAWITLT